MKKMVEKTVEDTVEGAVEDTLVSAVSAVTAMLKYSIKRPLCTTRNV